MVTRTALAACLGLMIGALSIPATVAAGTAGCAGVDAGAGAVGTMSTTDALAQIPELSTFTAALGASDVLDDVVGYHVVVGESLVGADLVAVGSVDTSSGPLPVAVVGDVVTLAGGQATVTCADITTADGTIHVIDTVLDPPAEQFTPGGASSVPGSSAPGSSVPR